MGFVEEYKELVENSNATINDKMEIDELFSHYGISHPKGTFIGSKITDYLYEKISKVLESKNTSELNHYLIRKIEDHFLLEYFFNGGSLEPYYTLEVISDAIRSIGNIVPFDEKDKWKEAIEAALDYNIISPSVFKRSSSKLKENNPRLYNLAKAAKYFKDKGYTIKLKDGKINIDELDLKKINKEIETTIKILGGIGAIKSLLSNLSSLFDKNLKRFHLNRRNGFGKVPLIPYGYLLNLAAKHTKVATQINDFSILEYYYTYLIEISMHLCVIYDVQPYNEWQLMFRNDIIEFIHEIALFDSIFTLIQLRPSDVPRTLKGLFNWINKTEMEKEVGFNLNNLLNVIGLIFNLSKGKIGPLIFKIDDLNYKGDPNVLKTILDTLSYDANIVNKDFYLPDDVPNNKSNFMFKPLIKLNENKYTLLDCSWRSPAFYEALASELRSKKPWEKLDDTLGIKFEEYVKQELVNNNVEYTSKKYKIGKKTFQCDLIIETDEIIIFIEIKKKGMRSASKAGDEINLILDLSKSLLNAQLQINSHETLLRKDGYIEFEDKTRLEFNERTIERITLTLLDYGGFQDRIVINQLLRVMLNVNFSVRISEYASDFKKLKKKTDKLKEQSKELSLYDPSFNKFPFFNCWFLSLPQLLILIDDSNDTESFVQNLRNVKFITHNSLDFYWEYGKLKSLI